ncbi:hypothetical protein QUF31_06100 [Dickeya chrysanthemi]|uniref:hypothetical protein n=1 Tax=Dickeya chrysanthemi TaxID=556 RepID=UPI0025A07D21|nr:hypothetical protein [Dickeya chrysanthemi]WJM86677.1 hypothetical protein QUF31_06100 [Dickeya chrysanthemi]
MVASWAVVIQPLCLYLLSHGLVAHSRVSQSITLCSRGQTKCRGRENAGSV